MAQMVKNLPAGQQTQIQTLGREDPLEMGMATHSSILDWRNPWTEEPGRLQSIELQRVGHDWATNTQTHTHTHTELVMVDTQKWCMYLWGIVCKGPIEEVIFNVFWLKSEYKHVTEREQGEEKVLAVKGNEHK